MTNEFATFPTEAEIHAHPQGAQYSLAGYLMNNFGSGDIMAICATHGFMTYREVNLFTRLCDQLGEHRHLFDYLADDEAIAMTALIEIKEELENDEDF